MSPPSSIFRHTFCSTLLLGLLLSSLGVTLMAQDPGTPLLTLTGLSGAQGSNQYYSFVVPAGKDVLVASGRIVSGRVRARVMYNQLPTEADLPPPGNSTFDTATVSNAQPGTWYLLVHYDTAATGVNIQITGYHTYAWYSAPLTSVPNAAAGSRTGAAHGSASLYFYKGTDSNMWGLYWNGTQWAQSQLTSDANVDDWLSYGTSYGLLAYKGKDNQLWVLYFNGSVWAAAPLGSTANVAGDVVMDDAWNLIYYRGTDSRVWVAYWTGTQWAQVSLGGAVPVVGSLAVDGSYHVVYFQAGGNQMWCYYWSGAAWLQARLSLAPNVGGSVAADPGGGLAYYRSSADSSAWCVYWNGSAWAYGQLDAAAAMGTSNSIAPLARNTALYLNSSGKCAAEYWNGTRWGNARHSDGNVVIFYYQ
jgi:hypothetical protein